MTPKADPAKTPKSVLEAFPPELEKRRELLAKVARDWLPAWSSTGECDHAELAKQAAELDPQRTRGQMAELDPQRARGQMAELVDRTQAWYARRYDAFARALAAEHGVSPASLRSGDPDEPAGFLRGELVQVVEKATTAVTELKKAGKAYGSIDALGAGSDKELQGKRLRANLEKSTEKVIAAGDEVATAANDLLAALWKKRTEKLTAEAPELALSAVRDRAEQAVTRQATAKVEREKAQGSGKREKEKRQWYHWLLDIALVAAAAYMIYVRFIRKEPEPPAAPPATAASASASTAPRVFVKPTDLRAGPGHHFASVETMTANTGVELLDAPTAGWIKVKVPSGKEGFVPVELVSVPARVAPRGTAPAPGPADAAPHD